jgi:hypothetical protein
VASVGVTAGGAKPFMINNLLAGLCDWLADVRDAFWKWLDNDGSFL